MLKALFFGLLLPGVAVSADFAGLWFSCSPEWGARDPYTLMEISRSGSSYRWTSEWGVPYSASGTALLRDGNLVLRGCKSYRGEKEQGCDEANPPMHVVLDKSILLPRKSPVKESLRRSDWIKTNQKSWQSLAAQCEELQNTIAKKTLDSK